MKKTLILAGVAGLLSTSAMAETVGVSMALFDDNFNRRHTVRPGITGLWQVEARDSARFEDLERHDLFYVENWSVMLDLAIMISTVSAVLGRAGRVLLHRAPATT